MTVEEARRLPPVRDVAFLRLGDLPVDDPNWDVGIQEVLAFPYYTAADSPPRTRTRSAELEPRFRPAGVEPQLKITWRSWIQVPRARLQTVSGSLQLGVPVGARELFQWVESGAHCQRRAFD